MVAPVPPLRPRKLLTMTDMGMDMSNHGGHAGHVRHVGREPGQGARAGSLVQNARPAICGAHWLEGTDRSRNCHDEAAAASMAGMDHSQMGMSGMAGMDHRQMGMSGMAGMDHNQMAAGGASGGMDHGHAGQLWPSRRHGWHGSWLRRQHEHGHA
jgi:hypothetical protein